MKIEKLHEYFGARITDVELSELDDTAFEDVRSAFYDYSVLVFPDQPLDDDQQVAFSQRFGELERTMLNDPTGGEVT
jgi:alpha-ketoglutarate-dependent 2,4-dichlorophenoxyacetate dioxygenase